MCLDTETILLEKLTHRKKKEIAYTECLELFREEDRKIFYSQMNQYRRLKRIDRYWKGKNRIYFILRKQ